MNPELKVGDKVYLKGAPPGQLYIVLEINPPLSREFPNIRQVYINEIRLHDSKFGVGESDLIKYVE